MQTSLNSIGLLAVTQENRLIKQNIYPIRNEHRTIASLLSRLRQMKRFKRTYKKRS